MENTTHYALFFGKVELCNPVMAASVAAHMLVETGLSLTSVDHCEELM